MTVRELMEELKKQGATEDSEVRIQYVIGVSTQRRKIAGVHYNSKIPAYLISAAPRRRLSSLKNTKG
jgi:hypothetical protein